MALYHVTATQTACEAVEGGVREGVSFEGLPEADYYCVEEMLPILPKVAFVYITYTFITITSNANFASNLLSRTPP